VKSFVCIAIVVWGLAMLYGQNLMLLRVNYSYVLLWIKGLS